MMAKFLIRVLLVIMVICTGFSTVAAREGDTLEPIAIEAPNLQTWPENLLNQDTDFRLINSRVQEARNSGVPLAVRIVDLTQENREIPFAMRPYAGEDFTQPFSVELQQKIAAAWMRSESIETREGADDGFLLLVLVPEDRTQTKAVWGIGSNALPLNGLTQENILATQKVMQEQFAQGNMPNGVFLGISEFSYNIQFGTPDRLIRSTLQNALHAATLPLAILTAIAGVSIPTIAFWLARKNRNVGAILADITPWEAAALHLGRAQAEIPASMLLDAVHQSDIAPIEGAGLQISAHAKGEVIDSLRPFANGDGVIDSSALHELESIMEPVRSGIERRLADLGAMTSDRKHDQARMLTVMGIALFLAMLTTVPSVKSMSASGVLAIVIAIVGVASGWWWLSYRRLTSPAGTALLASWLEAASSEDLTAYETVIHQKLLTDPAGGPNVTDQTHLMRTLRGLGSA